MYHSNIDFYIRDGENVISENYGVMPSKEYEKLCERMDFETFNEFGSMPNSRMIFSAYYDELTRQDDKRRESIRNIEECQRVYRI